jgi:hypothetical protein
VNCSIIQRRLLAAEQPDQPAAEVKSHLSECATCRAWQRRLVQMERQIAAMPVPPSTAKVKLLRRILSPSAIPNEAVRPAATQQPPLPWPAQKPGPKERGLRKMSVAFALAAALLVFALGWWAWPHNQPRVTTEPASLTRIQRQQKKLDERLAKVLLVDAPRERFLKLADLAEEVHGEARQMVDNADELDLWARFYTRVVREHLLVQARQLPPADRPAVLDRIALSLQRTESAATSLATKLKATSPNSAASFDRIALAARQGEEDLRALVNV